MCPSLEDHGCLLPSFMREVMLLGEGLEVLVMGSVLRIRGEWFLLSEFRRCCWCSKGWVRLSCSKSVAGTSVDRETTQGLQSWEWWATCEYTGATCLDRVRCRFFLCGAGAGIGKLGAGEAVAWSLITFSCCVSSCYKELRVSQNSVTCSLGYLWGFCGFISTGFIDSCNKGAVWLNRKEAAGFVHAAAVLDVFLRYLFFTSPVWWRNAIERCCAAGEAIRRKQNGVYAAVWQELETHFGFPLDLMLRVKQRSDSAV